MLQRCVKLEDSDCKNKIKGAIIRKKRELNQNKILKKNKRGKGKKKNKKASKVKNIDRSKINHVKTNVPIIKPKTSKARMNNDFEVPKYLGKLFKNLQGIKIEIVEICSDNFVSRIQYFIREDENLATSLEKVLYYHPEFNSIYCDKKKSSIQITYVNDRENYWSEINNSQKRRNCASSNVDDFDDQCTKCSSNDLKLLCEQYCKFSDCPKSRCQESESSKDVSTNNVDNRSDSKSISGYSSGVDESGFDSSNNNRNFITDNQNASSSRNGLSNEFLFGNENKDQYDNLIEIFANNDVVELQSNSEEIDNLKSFFSFDKDQHAKTQNVKECIHNNPTCDNDDSDNNKNHYKDNSNEKNSVKNMQKSQNIHLDSDIDVEDQLNSEPIYNFASIHAVNQLDYPRSDHDTSEEYASNNENQNPTNRNLEPSDNSEENAHLVDINNSLDHPTINYHTNFDVDGAFNLEINDSSSLKMESMIGNDFNSSKYRELLKKNDDIVDESAPIEQQYSDTEHVNSLVSKLEEGDELWKGIDDSTLDRNYEPKNNNYLHGNDNATMDDDFDSQNTEINFMTRGKDVDANDIETSNISAKYYLQEVTNTLGNDINTNKYQHTNQEANPNVEQLSNIESSNVSAIDFLGEDENAVSKNYYSEFSNSNEEANVNLEKQFNNEPYKITINDFMVEDDNIAVKKKHDVYKYTNQHNDVNTDEYQFGPNDKTAIENLHRIDTAANDENSNTAKEYVNIEDKYTNESGDISPIKPSNENYFNGHSRLIENGNEYLKEDDKGFENFDSPAELTKINEFGDDKTYSATEHPKDNIEGLFSNIPDREKLSSYNVETENTDYNYIGHGNLYGGKQSANGLNDEKTFLNNGNDGGVLDEVNDGNVKLNSIKKDSDELHYGDIKLYRKKGDLGMLNRENIKMFAEKEDLKESIDENTNLLYSYSNNTKEDSDKLIDGNIHEHSEKEVLDGLKDDIINFTNRKESSHGLGDKSINFINKKESLNGPTDENINLYNDENTFLNNRLESSGILKHEKINLNIEKEGSNALNNENIILNNSKDVLNELDQGNINLNERKESSNVLNNNVYNGKDNANNYYSQNSYLPYAHPGIQDGNAYLHNGNPTGLNTGNINWQGVKNDGYANYQDEKVNSISPYGNADFFEGKESANVLNDRNVPLQGVKSNSPELNNNEYLYGANNVGGNMYGINNGHPMLYGAHNVNGINGHFNGYNGGVGNMHRVYNQNGLYGHNGVIGFPPGAAGNPHGNINGYGNFYGNSNPHLHGVYNGNEKSFTGHNTNNGALKGVEINPVKTLTENTKTPLQTTGLNERKGTNLGGSTNSFKPPFINQPTNNNYINGNGQNYYNIHPPNPYNGHMNGFDYTNYQNHNVFANKYPNPIVYTAKYPNDHNAKYQNQNDFTNTYQHQNDYIGKYKPPNTDINQGLAKTKSDAIVIPDTNKKNVEKKHSVKIEINNKPFHLGELSRNAIDSLFEKTKDIIPATVDEQEFEKYFKLRSLNKAEANNEELTKKEIMKNKQNIN